MPVIGAHPTRRIVAKQRHVVITNSCLSKIREHFHGRRSTEYKHSQVSQDGWRQFAARDRARGGGSGRERESGRGQLLSCASHAEDSGTRVGSCVRRRNSFAIGRNSASRLAWRPISSAPLSS